MTWTERPPEPISDAELAELQRSARLTALWDDQERDELAAKLAEAHRQRGWGPPAPLPCWRD